MSIRVLGQTLASSARMRAAFAFALILAACAYKPGSFSPPLQPARFSGEQLTVGCLDVGVARRTDLGTAAVLEYSFGNRCDRPATVDLAWAQVIGRTSNGAEIALVPYDPGLELRPVALEARTVGSESISYQSAESLGQVCVDVASIAQAKPARWVCFGNTESVAMVDP